MYSKHNINSMNPYYFSNEERFIGPILPFVGGALVGYIAGRPQYNFAQPYYYPVYYQPYQYYQQPYYNNYYPQTNRSN